MSPIRDSGVMIPAGSLRRWTRRPGRITATDHLGPSPCPLMVNIQALIDDAKCFETVRAMRWPDGVRCAECDSADVIKDGHDDTQPRRQPSMPGCRSGGYTHRTVCHAAGEFPRDEEGDGAGCRRARP